MPISNGARDRHLGPHAATADDCRHHSRGRRRWLPDSRKGPTSAVAVETAPLPLRGLESGHRLSQLVERQSGHEEARCALAALTIARVGGPPSTWRWGRRIALVVGALVGMLVLGSCGGAHSASAASDAVPVESYQHVPGPPFGVVTTSDGRYAFVALASDRPFARSTRVLSTGSCWSPTADRVRQF
jgi:hypothetical protein